MSKCNPAWLEKSLPCLIDLLILPTGKKKTHKTSGVLPDQTPDLILDDGQFP